MVAPQWQFNVSLINSLTSVQQYFNFFIFQFSLFFRVSANIHSLSVASLYLHSAWDLGLTSTLLCVVHVIRVQNVPNHNWTTIWMGLWEFTERVYTISQVVCLHESLSLHSGRDEMFLVLLRDRAWRGYIWLPGGCTGTWGLLVSSLHIWCQPQRSISACSQTWICRSERQSKSKHCYFCRLRRTVWKR